MASRYVARFINRNPRNMEMMGKQIKPTGYQFEADREKRSFIYRVDLIQTKSHQEAKLTHYINGVVITASTKEPAISNQLYSNTDTCAALNLGRVLANRCLQSGIHFALPGSTPDMVERSSHQKEFYKALAQEGLTLSEPEGIEHTYENDNRLTWERYPTKHNRQDKLDEL
ncbi:unnamed protein product [Auanema sp. JU1783]|nr:unnamed protein product [Auanema sp. JU1783]